MKRVMIIGPGGAGKSTFAKQLHERTGLPLIHLDAHFWKRGWVPSTTEEIAVMQKQWVQGEEWIIDGNYGATLEIRFAACDTVIYFDFPTYMTLYGILKRRLMYHGQSRSDMGEGYIEKLDWIFIKWVATYRRRKRPHILRALTELPREKNVIIFRSRSDVRRFLQEIEQKPSEKRRDF
ncbi:DNA topology modulation protein [Halalkalibacterium halodurans]|uniref:DNA topology modulation protein n=1 Tax=Halalkalibacterium halodurans TaxID=86665 RepID=UPI002E1D17C2|nr:DNA topology modulation protein [Halalkalibacterium halodurans]MED4086505.1 DNA topology modulation protein [Halalkalibacterium halodurans]MED4104786.1 DNA topology modulation protein [Halalkalibacterium halodurans]MED4109637.1 DNA topology modulation protein [Halalkalibacterium halodurans]MED4150084.1 DNA topology modulation protein [Halalkalibacterium halodurans]